MTKPTLQIIIGSNRPGRIGPTVAAWARDRALAHGGFEVELIDLAEVGLPFLDEPHHPRLRQYTRQHTKDWSATIDRGDAYLFVVPEYNHGFNAVTKNAIDFLHQEWQHKPAGFVSYGGVAAGTRAVQMLKQVVAMLKMAPVAESVNIPFVRELVEDGELRANDVMEAAIKTTLDELQRWAAALRPLREQQAGAA